MLTLVVLYATWCPKCHMMLPVVEELEKEFAGMWNVIRIDVEKQPEMIELYEVEIVPTFVMKENGEEIGRMAGMIGEETLRRRLKGCSAERKIE